MLSTITKFFKENLDLSSDVEDKTHSLKLATAALFVEMMQQDEKVHEEEEEQAKQLLMKKFDLSQAESETLFSLAHEEAKDANDYYQFTRLINDGFPLEKKILVVEYLWQIAYADGHLDSYEEHMVRRIAELIYVPHSEFIQAKLRVQSTL